MTPTPIAVAVLAGIPLSIYLYVNYIRKKSTAQDWIARRCAEPPATKGLADFSTLHAEPSRFKLASGRYLAYSIYGRSSSTSSIRTIVFIHGQPGSRLPPLKDLAERCNALDGSGQPVRVICVERPGYGYSDFDPEMTPASFARDLDALLDSLDLASNGKIEIVGYSLGGPHALVFSTLFPNKVSKLTLLAPVGFISPPPNATERIAPVNKTAHALVHSGRGWVLKMIWSLAGNVMCNPQAHFTGQMVPSLAEADKKLFSEDPGVLKLWESSSAEAFRNGVDGPLRDVLTLLGTEHGKEEDKWGVKIGKLEDGVDATKVVVWGDQDGLVSREMVDYLSDVIGAELVVAPGVGHFGVLDERYWLA